MQSAPTAQTNASSQIRLVTTLVCCLWGYTFAYAFFRCLLDRVDVLACIAAALPLGAVWAALERRRWGRLVLIGQSLLAVALFAAIFVVVAWSGAVPLSISDQNLVGYLAASLRLFGETPEASLGTLALSTMTAIWLCTPTVRDEYEQKKKPFLTPGQRIIALAVISLWCLTMVTTPTLLESRSSNVPLRTPRRLTHRF